jgi:peptide/nickel transport system substrate-binding protein
MLESSTALTRRRFLALFASAAGVAVAACAPTSPPAPTAVPAKPAEGQAKPAAPAAPAAPAPAAPAAPAAKPAEAVKPAAPAAAPAASGGQLVVALQQGWASADPARSTAVTDWAVVQALYNGLLRYKPGGFDLEPSLAESWDVSADGKEYVFKLRRGVEFHKGFGELTADDVKFSIDRHDDPAVKSLIKAELWMVDKVEVVDKYTVKFSLKVPYGAFLSSIALGRPHVGAIISKAAAEKLGNDTYTEHPIGTGPFVFDNAVPNQHMIFTRNDKYYEGPAKVDSLKFLNMPDETTVGLAVEKGEVHLGDIRDADIHEKYKDTPRTSVLIGDRFNVVYLMLNTRLKPLDDPRVRQALAKAVNSPEIIQGVFAGIATLATAGVLHPKMLGFDESIKPLEYDPDKARSELAAAGAANLTLNAVTYTGSEWTTVLALMQQQLAKAGVNFKFEQLERATLNQRRAAPENQSVLISVTTGPDPDRMMSYLHSSQLPPSGNNFSWYAGADALIDQSRQEAEQQKRAALVGQVQRKFAEDMPVIPMYYNKSMVILSKNVQGYTMDSFGGHFLQPVSIRA